MNGARSQANSIILEKKMEGTIEFDSEDTMNEFIEHMYWLTLHESTSSANVPASCAKSQPTWWNEEVQDCVLYAKRVRRLKSRNPLDESLGEEYRKAVSQRRNAIRRAKRKDARENEQSGGNAHTEHLDATLSS